jgi:hypothetical protein
LCPYSYGRKSNPIDVAVAVKEVLGFGKLGGLIGDATSRKVILNAVKESTDKSGKVDCRRVLEELLHRKKLVWEKIAVVVQLGDMIEK